MELAIELMAAGGCWVGFGAVSRRQEENAQPDKVRVEKLETARAAMQKHRCNCRCGCNKG